MTTTVASNRTPSTNAPSAPSTSTAAPTSTTETVLDVAQLVVDYTMPAVKMGLDTVDRLRGAGKAIGVIAASDTAAGKLDVGQTATTELAVKGTNGAFYGEASGQLTTERTETGFDVGMQVKTGLGAQAGGDKLEVSGGGVLGVKAVFGAKTAEEADALRSQLAESAALGVVRSLAPSMPGSMGGAVALSSAVDRNLAKAKLVDSELTATASAELALFDVEGAPQKAAAEASLELAAEAGAHMIVTNENGVKKVSFEARAKVGAEGALDVGNMGAAMEFSSGRKVGYDATLVHRTTFDLPADFPMEKSTDLLAIRGAIAGQAGKSDVGVEVTSSLDTQTVDGKLFVEGGVDEAMKIARSIVEGDPSLARGVKVTGEVTRSTKAQVDPAMKGYGLDVSGSAGTTTKLKTVPTNDGASFVKEMAKQTSIGVGSLRPL